MKVTDIVKDFKKDLRITGKRSLSRVYRTLDVAASKGALPISGVELVTLNDLCEAAGIPERYKDSYDKEGNITYKGNEDARNWDFQDTDELTAFIDKLKPSPTSASSKSSQPSPTTRNLAQAINEAADTLKQEKATKADISAALSNLVQVYALMMHPLRLPKLPESKYPMPTELPEGYELPKGAEIAADKNGLVGIRKSSKVEAETEAEAQ